MKPHRSIIGIDEVGRGPLAGPVSVAAFSVAQKELLFVQQELLGITDSKKLSSQQRERYFRKIQDLKKAGKLSFACSHVSAKVIDAKGIQYALSLALRRSLTKLSISKEDSFIYLDGGLYAPLGYKQKTVIKGDAKIFHIACASVVAKVLRDRLMIRLGKKYPQYALERHKGYGTQYHRDMIKKHGVRDIHRLSWIKA